jgi:hypothetical protein
LFTIKHYINIFSLFFTGLICSVYVFWLSDLFHLNSIIITVLFLILLWGGAIVIGNYFIKEEKKNLNKISVLSLSIIVVLTFFSVLIILLFDRVSFYLPAEFFVSSVLIIALFFLTENNIPVNKLNFTFFAYAFLFGMLLFLRSVAAIPFVIFILYYFRNNLVSVALFSLSALFIYFVLLFIFMGNTSEIFLMRDPYIIKLFLFAHPWWVTSLVVFFTLYAGYSVADLQEVFFSSGILLTIPVIYGFIEKCVSMNFYQAVAGFDNINYFLIFPLPFFILSIKHYKVDRFLGKIIG